MSCDFKLTNRDRKCIRFVAEKLSLVYTNTSANWRKYIPEARTALVHFGACTSLEETARWAPEQINAIEDWQDEL